MLWLKLYLFDKCKQCENIELMKVLSSKTLVWYLFYVAEIQ